MVQVATNGATNGGVFESLSLPPWAKPSQDWSEQRAAWWVINCHVLRGITRSKESEKLSVLIYWGRAVGLTKNCLYRCPESLPLQTDDGFCPYIHRSWRVLQNWTRGLSRTNMNWAPLPAFSHLFWPRKGIHHTFLSKVWQFCQPIASPATAGAA